VIDVTALISEEKWAILIAQVTFGTDSSFFALEAGGKTSLAHASSGA
jgi:hypothetical protein